MVEEAGIGEDGRVWKSGVFVEMERLSVCEGMEK